jgi:hypothetical protein
MTDQFHNLREAGRPADQPVRDRIVKKFEAREPSR